MMANHGLDSGEEHGDKGKKREYDDSDDLSDSELSGSSSDGEESASQSEDEDTVVVKAARTVRHTGHLEDFIPLGKSEPDGRYARRRQ